jgi:hypothetical protein
MKHNDGSTACSAPTGESCVMLRQKYTSECRPTALLLPVRPGGFGKPLWQLLNRDTRSARGSPHFTQDIRPAQSATSPTFVSWFREPRMGYLEEKRKKSVILCCRYVCSGACQRSDLRAVGWSVADAISPQALSELIGSIYDCALDPSRWDQTLPDVMDALDCHLMALHLTDLRHQLSSY